MVIYTTKVEATSSLDYNLISSSTILSKEQILEDSFKKNHGSQENPRAPDWKKNSFFAH